MTTGTRNVGEFCWINILTPQPEDARAFFAKLLGWTFEDMPPFGHTILAGGHEIGGLFDLAGPNTPPGTPPQLGVMVKVASADAVCDKAQSLGGTALPAFDIMEHGRMACLTDPNGAKFDLWQPGDKPGTDSDTDDPGAPSWFETMTTDVARATAFYTSLFGWTADVIEMPGVNYTLFKLGEEMVAGMMELPEEAKAAGPHWATYFTVKSADDSAKLAAELGATLTIPPMDIPGIGRFAGITSPQGITFYVIEYSR